MTGSGRGSGSKDEGADAAAADKLFAPPPTEEVAQPDLDEFEAAQMSGSWFTAEKTQNLGGPRTRYALGAPPPVIATKRRTRTEPEPIAATEGRAQVKEERANPLLIAAGIAVLVALLVSFIFLFGVRAFR